MASLLDKSLDEIIKERQPAKKKDGPKGGRGGRGGRGDTGRGGGRGGRGGRSMGAPVRGKTIAKPARAVAVPARPKPGLRKNIRMMVDNDSWEHDMYDVQQPREPRAPRGGFETGTKLLITNLHWNVSEEDIKELFEELGSLKRSAMHYDRSGRSKGSAEVIFTRKQDAAAALRRYNGVRLDGQAMEIEMITGQEGGMGSRLSGGPSAGPSGGRREVVSRPFGGRGMGGRGGRSVGGGRGGGRGFGGRGGRGGGRRGSNKSAADLDAELDSYHDMES